MSSEGCSMSDFQKLLDQALEKVNLTPVDDTPEIEEYDIDKDAAFLIGDKPRDVESAEAAGIKGYLFSGGNLLNFVKEIVG